MKIGMMADMYKPYISGVTTYISLNKRYLEKNGHEVFIFTFGNGKYPIDEPNIIRSPGFPIKKGEIHFNLDHSRSAKALLRTMDIVHVHHPLFSGSIALRECRPNHIPIVFTNHTRFDIYFLMYIPGFLKKTFYRILKLYLKNFFNKIDTVIVPSQSMKNVVRQFGNDFTVEVEPHGMELEPFFRRGIARDRSEFGFQPDDILLVYVGRLWPEKNVPLLIKAFEIICRDWDRARLLVVGDGPDRGKLESLVTQMELNSKVFFTGAIPFAELPPYYKAGDIFVTPSSTETFGLTVVEAMASGLPVVGINSPGISDTVVPGKTGLLASNDLDDLTRQLIRLISDEDFRKELGANAIRESENYRIENSVERLVILYKNIIEKRKAGTLEATIDPKS